MKIPHQLRQLRRRLGRSDHSSWVDDAEITLEPRAPEFPNQSQRADEHSSEGRLPKWNADALRTSGSWRTPLCDRIRGQGAVPFDRDWSDNHKSLCASTTIPRQVTRRLAHGRGSCHDPGLKSEEMKSGRLPQIARGETGPTGDRSQRRRHCTMTISAIGLPGTGLEWQVGNRRSRCPGCSRYHRRLENL
jgi:hypothetical protein